MGNIKIIKENEKSYTAIADGKKVVLWKIDTEELEKKWKERVFHARQYLKRVEIVELKDNLNMLLQHKPNVDDYEEIAIDISETIEKFIDTTPSAYNVYHTLYKYLNPECYGKAQTFTKYCCELLQLLETMLTFKVEEE